VGRRVEKRTVRRETKGLAKIEKMVDIVRGKMRRIGKLWEIPKSVVI
jgi:hypothetical protein